jgi:hypothetical protein
MAAATGIQTTRQRGVRQPVATTKMTTATSSTVSGSQPPSSEIPCPNLPKSGSGNGGIGVGVGTGGVVEGPIGGTPPVSKRLLKKR